MPRPSDREVLRFALRVAAWLVPCLAAWYFLAPFHARPVAWLARLGVAVLARDIVTGLEWAGATVTFLTDIAIRVADGREGLLTVDTNPLVYTYGMALFAALSLASRMTPARIVLGLLILLPFQAWGVAFEVLVEIGVKAPREAAVAAGIGDFERELLPLAYQAGSLLFPVLVPVGAWAALGGLRPWMPEAFVKEKAAPR
jgi:hypothetical protein